MEVTGSNKTVPWLTKTTNQASIAEKQNQLGKDDFLKLLITQLKYQDPTSPMDNQEFIAQMASFSALEQMNNLNAGFTNLAKTINETLIPNFTLQQSGSMIGREVSYLNTITTPEGNESTETKTGTIQSVILKQGVPYYVIDGKEVAGNNITKLSQNTDLATDEQILLEILNILDQMQSLMGPKEGGEDGQ